MFGNILDYFAGNWKVVVINPTKMRPNHIYTFRVGNDQVAVGQSEVHNYQLDMMASLTAYKDTDGF